MSFLHGEKLLDHFRNPRNPGVLAPPALTVEVENPACGDRLRLSAALHEGRIARAAFQALGCTASIAAGSALTEWLLGRVPSDILNQTDAVIAAEIEALLGGLIPASRHAAALAADAALTLAARLAAARACPP